MALRPATTEELGNLKGLKQPGSISSAPVAEAASTQHPRYSSLRVQQPSTGGVQQSALPTSQKSDVKGGIVGHVLSGSTQRFGRTIGETLAAPKNIEDYSKAAKSHADIQYKLAKTIGEKKKLGQDTARLEEAMQMHIKDAPDMKKFTGDVLDKKVGQVLGEAGGTVLEALGGGALSGGIKALKATSTLGKIGQAARVGAGYGVAGGATNAMQEGVGVGGTLKGAAVGGLIGGVLGGGLGVAGAGISKLPKLIPKSESILNRVARLTPTDANKFKNMSGISHGEYLKQTGNIGTPEQIIEKEAQKFVNSLNHVDDELAKLPGTYKDEALDQALNELASRESRIGISGEGSSRIQELFNKNQAKGLTMSEINEAKRLFEKNVKLDFVRQNLPESIEKATRIDNALRKWQFELADNLGLKNLPDINKQTQLSRFIVDKLGKQVAGKTGNEALNLTDWIVLSGGDPTAVGAFLSKKLITSNKFQAMVAKGLAGKPTREFVTAKYGGKKGLPALIPGRDYSTTVPNSNKFKPIPLPKSVRKTNLGTDEITQTSRIETPLIKSQPKLSEKMSYNKTTPEPKVKSTDLAQEAKKYKSAEEFVKAQGIPIYHGSNEKIGIFTPKKGAQGVIWFTDNPKAITAGESGAQGTKYVNERITTGQKFAGWDEYEKFGLGQIKDMGFDGIKLPTKMQDGTPYNDYILFDSKTIKSKSQLTNIYNKAKGKLGKKPPKLGKSQPGFINPKTLAVGVAATSGLVPLIRPKKAETPPAPPKPPLESKTLGNALMQLESSGGTNKKNADGKEMKWLTGLTPIAIKELKRTGIKDSVDINNKEDVIDASIKYFKLMQKRYPDLTPAEIYVDHYWTQAGSPEKRQKKIDEFNRLVNQ